MLLWSVGKHLQNKYWLHLFVTKAISKDCQQCTLLASYKWIILWIAYIKAISFSKTKNSHYNEWSKQKVVNQIICCYSSTVYDITRQTQQSKYLRQVFAKMTLISQCTSAQGIQLWKKQIWICGIKIARTCTVHVNSFIQIVVPWSCDSYYVM